MTVIVINDAMAVLRARLEKDLARFSLNKLVLELNQSPHVQIWVWDGAGNKKKRQEIYPEYKAKRKPAGPSIFEGMMLLKDVLKCTRGISIEVPGYEADDAIAAVTQQYAGKLPVAINTRDFDLRALCALSPMVTCTVEPKPDVPDHMIRLYKTWVGDPSDNISGVKGFGKGAWEKADKAELQSFTDQLLAGNVPDFMPQTIAPKHHNWAVENADTFRAMHTVIGFLEIPQALLDKHTVKGSGSIAEADRLLKEFFL